MQGHPWQQAPENISQLAAVVACFGWGAAMVALRTAETYTCAAISAGISMLLLACYSLHASTPQKRVKSIIPTHAKGLAGEGQGGYDSWRGPSPFGWGPARDAKAQPSEGRILRESRRYRKPICNIGCQPQLSVFPSTISKTTMMHEATAAESCYSKCAHSMSSALHARAQ